MSAETSEVTPPTASRRAFDVITALLAVWLFISPWVLEYGTGDSWNTWIASAIIFLIALSALNRPMVGKEIANMVLGAWMFISPWVLGFSNPSPGASWNQWLVGALVFLISGACILSRRNLEGAGGLQHAHLHR
jgi:hypothetical protein